ncbi:MAG: MFS transporter, partial [Planctomycetes bacterium]|nr:MFS transporter [Planctomycetota bacterium]
PFVVWGYSLSTVARTLIAAAASPLHVFGLRLADRVGKGLRTSPRDALIAAAVPSEFRGRAFSVQRAMDHTGAILGSLVAAAALFWWTDDLRLVFWMMAVPGVLAVLVLVLAVREEDSDLPAALTAEPGKSGKSGKPDTPAASRREALGFLAPLSVFTLGRASDAFLLLAAYDVVQDKRMLPLLWAALHAVKVGASIPGGVLADRIGRRRAIGIGWFVSAAILAGFAFAASPLAILLLFLAHGLHHGLSEGPERALVAQFAPRGARGTAFGVYHVTAGIVALAGSLLYGGLWDLASRRVAFLAGTGLATLGVVLLLALAPRSAAASLKTSI